MGSPIKVDILIAATAKYLDLPIITNDPAVFK
jgi:hypothetical protein